MRPYVTTSFLGGLLCALLLALPVQAGGTKVYLPLVVTLPAKQGPHDPVRSGFVVIPPTHTHFVKHGTTDTFVFVGEIETDSGFRVSDLTITVELLNGDEVVASAPATVPLHHFYTGGPTICFTAEITHPGAGWNRYRFTNIVATTSTDQFLVIDPSLRGYDSYAHPLLFNGRINGWGNHSLQQVFVEIVLYDLHHKVYDCAGTGPFVVPQGGGSTPYTVTFSARSSYAPGTWDIMRARASGLAP